MHTIAKAYNPAAGDWQHLKESSQRARYLALAAHIPKESMVLDIGCGTAVLASYLEQDSGYFGIDPSSLAIEEARKTRTGIVLCDSAENFVPLVDYDVIVFNECLYYMDDPIDMLRKYRSYLRPGGRFIISIYCHGKRPSLRSMILHAFNLNRPKSNDHCWSMVEDWCRREEVHVLREEAIRHPSGKGVWRIAVIQP